MDIKSIKLISNNIGYGPMPLPNEEVEQHLTISSSGRVWFSARSYEQWEQGRGTRWKKQVNIGPWKAQFLLDLIDKIHSDLMVMDCGEYTLTIRYQDGSVRKTSGSLYEDVMVPLYGGFTSITKLLRRYIPIRELWGFNEDTADDYDGKKAIFEFSKHWGKFFSAAKPSKEEFAQTFGNACTSLGFRMDCGNEFSARYPECFCIPSPELDAVIGSIQDVDLLGSAVFSQWRFLTHWEYSFELDKDTRHWFKVILKRMQELTKNRKFTISIEE